MSKAMSPFRRFSLGLAGFLLAGTLLVGITAGWAIQNLLLKETVEGTKVAADKHLGMFGLPEWMEGASGAAAESQAPEARQYALSPGMTPAQIDAQVRLHFALYDIAYAAFYDQSGVIRYSYRPGEVGASLPATERSWFDSALQGRTRVDTDNVWQGHRAFRIMLPLLDEDGGEVSGAVLLVRDIDHEVRMIRLIQALIAGVMAMVAAGLFIGLRRVFMGAADQIMTKTADLERMVALVEATYDATLKALSAALDFRDNETEGHSRRVTLCATRLGQELGLSGQPLVELTRGAVLHDVGKIGIPDAVLLKPGALSQDEWRLMRQHPRMGHEMLREIEFLRPALPVVLCHHERWDGTGYPAGLCGDQIPLGARIFAVCDTLDAICSDRPYRKARTYAEARAEITRCAGTQFDPAVVEAFLRIPEQEWDLIRESVASSCKAGLSVAAS